MRQKVAGSLNTNMPTITDPTAPMPVQTAYAVPMGNDRVALYNSDILINRHTTKPTPHKVAVEPVVSLILPRQEAKPVSNNPAMINSIQFMALLCSEVQLLRAY